MADIEMISISKEKYDQLIEDQKRLKALKVVDVDNWEGPDQWGACNLGKEKLCWRCGKEPRSKHLNGDCP